MLTPQDLGIVETLVAEVCPLRGLRMVDGSVQLLFDQSSTPAHRQAARDILENLSAQSGEELQVTRAAARRKQRLAALPADVRQAIKALADTAEPDALMLKTALLAVLKILLESQ